MPSSWANARMNMSDEQRSSIASDAARKRWDQKTRARVEAQRGDKTSAEIVLTTRLERGLSQCNAARQIGISGVTLSRLEAGNRNVGPEFVAKALAWVAAPPMATLPPVHQRPQREPTQPLPVEKPVRVVPRAPDMLFSARCMWWGRDCAISVETCKSTRDKRRCTHHATCPGIAVLALV